MILGPNDPRARSKADGIFSGSTLDDFDAFLETADGNALIDAILDGWPAPRCIICDKVLDPAVDPAVTTLGPRCVKHFS